VTLGAAVRLIDAVLEPILDGANHTFETGSVSQVVTGGEDDCALLVKVFTGLARLREGKIVLLGHDLGVVPRETLSSVRSRMAIVYPGGGLISNLKVLENITLPLLYHTSGSKREIVERAIAVLGRFGLTGTLFDLPAHLSTFQHRLAGFARAIAIDPEVVVYDRLADGLGDEERDLLVRAALAFHAEKPGRATIFLTPRLGVIAGDDPATILRLTKGRFA
jgi:phospholipid/cholesterol/gamma-HCH transport system ATP-binding protein